MRISEISKRGADIPRGKILMAIEGDAHAVACIADMLAVDGYASTKCSEIGDVEGEIIEFFVISRADKADFMRAYKLIKGRKQCEK